MPPKRKAPSAAADDAQPAAKRALRSNKVVLNDVTALPVKTRRSRRAVAASDAVADSAAAPQDTAVVASRTRRAVNNSGTTAADDADSQPGQSRSRPKTQKKPITTNRRVNYAVVEDNVDEEADELLLSPSKKHERPVTPPRPSTPKASAPRIFMECVEILTPSRRLADGTPSATRFLNLAGAAAEVHPRQSTPSPSKRTAPPTSPSKPRSTDRVRASPDVEDAVQFAGPSTAPISPPTTPGKRKPKTRTPTASPSKRRGIASVQSSPTRQAKTLPPHLYACLHAQQRAILQSLRNVPEIEREGIEHDEDEDPPANTVALEELSNLLRGTVLRGEGNSCLLIGPRGSGKTRVGSMIASSSTCSHHS